MDEEMDDFKGRSPYSSTFRTFDSTDYSSIGTHNYVPSSFQVMQSPKI